MRLGDTTVVCGVKAEIAEPDLDRPEDGFLGVSYCSLLPPLDMRHADTTHDSAQPGPPSDMLPEVQAGTAIGGGAGAVRQALRDLARVSRIDRAVLNSTLG